MAIKLRISKMIYLMEVPVSVIIHSFITRNMLFMHVVTHIYCNGRSSFICSENKNKWNISLCGVTKK